MRFCLKISLEISFEKIFYFLKDFYKINISFSMYLESGLYTLFDAFPFHQKIILKHSFYFFLLKIYLTQEV